jgi:histidine triad (HIT) family protein
MYDDNNIFAKIIRGEMDSDKIYEDDKLIAIHDAYPTAPIHVLVIPKGKYISFHDFMENAAAEEIAHFFKTTKQIAEMLNLGDKGYRILANIGKTAGQTVFHMHLHILSGKTLQ